MPLTPAGGGAGPITPTRITLPLLDDRFNPTLAWGDGDTGFYQPIDNQIVVSIATISRFIFVGSNFQGFSTNSFSLQSEVASATNPTMSPDKSDLDTGIGRTAVDQLSLIAGGVQVANLTEAAGVVQFIVPSQNNSANPSIAFGDGDTGFFELFDDILVLATLGTNRSFWNVDEFRGALLGSYSLRNEATTDTNPVLSFEGDADTGIGRRTQNIGVLIAGAQNVMEFAAVSGVPQVGFYGTAAINLQTGVAVTAAGIHAALVNLGLITA